MLLNERKLETLKNACFLISSAPRPPRRLAGSRISSCCMKLFVALENFFGNITSPRRMRLHNSDIKQSLHFGTKNGRDRIPNLTYWYTNFYWSREAVA